MNEMSLKVPKIKSVENSSIFTNRSKKSRTSKVSIQEAPSQSEQIEDIGPHPLSPEYIVLRNKSAERLFHAEKNIIVPPGSPRRDFIHGKNIDTIPTKIRSVIKLNIPYVRVLGIKKTIDVLGEFFGCTLYRTSLLQFWFLDMVADCLWRCQDEFMLSEKYQKDVLGWVLHFFDIIRDPLLNFSRGQFFRLFRETLVLAEDHIECGDSHFPSPEDLFTLNFPPDHPVDFDALISESDDSSLSFNDSCSEHSFLVMPSKEYPDLPEFYELPAKDCRCAISVRSSLETISEKSIHIGNQEDDLHPNSVADENDVDISYSISEFYQPNSNIHSRFIDVIEENDERSIVPDEMQHNDSSDVEYEWMNEPEKKYFRPLENSTSAVTMNSHDAASTFSSTTKRRSFSAKSKTKLEGNRAPEDTVSVQALTLKKSKVKVPTKPQEVKKSDETELLRAWFDYNIWEQRKKDMADPHKGWKPNEPEQCSDDCICSKMEYSPEDFENEEYVHIKNEWLQYLNKHKLAIDQSTQNVFVNSCLLLIVKQLIFD